MSAGSNEQFKKQSCDPSQSWEQPTFVYDSRIQLHRDWRTDDLAQKATGVPCIARRLVALNVAIDLILWFDHNYCYRL